ncbi:MAG TPA: magnesium chelatase, partial [Verrucomicrobia bacterium]|nr:magnesium chelatase [Verrucomicrobiota bacterium]
MIRFAEPLLLLLLLIIPVLLFLRNRRRTPILFSRVQLFETLPSSWAQKGQPLLPILYTLSLIFLVIALARPQRGLDESIVRTEAVDMILLLDLSESMDTQDFT